MVHNLPRREYADYLARVIREESPGIIEMRAGVSILATRNLVLENKLAKAGFVIHLGPSLDRPKVGRVDPIIFVKEESNWRVIDSLWTLGRLAGGGTASAFAQNPLMLLDGSSAMAVVKRILPRIRETGVMRGDLVSEMLSHNAGNPSIIGEKPSEEIQGILTRLIPYLYDEYVDVRGKVNILLGGWSVEGFRKQFSLQLEAIRILEEEAQREYDSLNQLVRVDEFISLREEEFSLVGKDAEVSLRIALGWIFYSLGRRPTGETFTREYYNELGKKDVGWIDPEDAGRWKEIMLKTVSEILEEWLSSRKTSLKEEPETDARSSTLDRMVRSLTGEEHKISGSLEGLF